MLEFKNCTFSEIDKEKAIKVIQFDCYGYIPIENIYVIPPCTQEEKKRLEEYNRPSWLKRLWKRLKGRK